MSDFGGGGRYCPDVPKVYYTHFNAYSVFKQILCEMSRLDWRPSTIWVSNFIRVFNFNGECLNVFELLTMCESKLMSMVSFSFPIVLEIIYYNLIFLFFNLFVESCARIESTRKPLYESIQR